MNKEQTYSFFIRILGIPSGPGVHEDFNLEISSKISDKQIFRPIPVKNAQSNPI